MSGDTTPESADRGTEAGATQDANAEEQERGRRTLTRRTGAEVTRLLEGARGDRRGQRGRAGGGAQPVG